MKKRKYVAKDTHLQSFQCGWLCAAAVGSLQINYKRTNQSLTKHWPSLVASTLHGHGSLSWVAVLTVTDCEDTCAVKKFLKNTTKIGWHQACRAEKKQQMDKRTITNLILLHVCVINSCFFVYICSQCNGSTSVYIDNASTSTSTIPFWELGKCGSSRVYR